MELLSPLEPALVQGAANNQGAAFQGRAQGPAHGVLQCVEDGEAKGVPLLQKQAWEEATEEPREGQALGETRVR